MVTVFTRRQHIYDTVWISTEMKHFIFQVKTCEDANIMLNDAPWAPENGGMYFVIFCSRQNTMTELRRSRGGPSLVRIRTMGVCSCQEFRTFWISWYNNTVAAGTGTFVGQKQIFSFTDPYPKTVSALSFSSWLRSSGIWMFSRDSGDYWLMIMIFIVAFLENATVGYSLESLCVCPCLCVFLHDNSKRNRSRNTKLKYVVVYENSSDEFDIELHRIKVKVTVGVQKFSPFTTIQTVRSYSSTLVQARNLILSIYLHLI